MREMNMKKQFVLTTATLLACTALSAPAFAELKTYAGIGGGINQMRMHKDVVQQRPSIGTETNYTHKDKSTGATGGLYAGIGDKINMYYVGGELDLNKQFNSKASSTITDKENAVHSAWEQNPWTTSASLIGGVYALPHTLFYGKAGVAYGQFKMGTPNDAYTTGYNGSMTKWRPGMLLGTGVQYDVTKHIGAKLEYDFTKYKSFSAQSPLDIQSKAGSNPVFTKYKPNNNQIILGVTYTF